MVYSSTNNYVQQLEEQCSSSCGDAVRAVSLQEHALNITSLSQHICQQGDGTALHNICLQGYHDRGYLESSLRVW
jgi:hypothetical protein